MMHGCDLTQRFGKINPNYHGMSLPYEVARDDAVLHWWRVFVKLGDIS